VFISGADDKLATVDLYKASGEVINDIRDISEAFKANSLSGLFGGNTLLDSAKLDIIKSFDQATAGLVMDSDSLVKGIIAINPGMVSALRSLPSSIQGELTNVKGLITNITGTFNGIKAEITKASLSTINGLGSLINGISGANLPFNFTDKNGLAKLSSSLIIQATKVGIPGVFTAFVNEITDKKIIKDIVTEVSKYAIVNSAEGLLSDIANSPAGRILSSVTGGMALRVTQDYTKPTNSSVLQQYQKYQTIKNTLDTAIAQWNTYQRPGALAYEAGFMSTASDDFFTAVSTAAKFQTKRIIPNNPGSINTAAGTSAEAYMALITRNPNMTAKTAIKQNFPLVYIR
jgi:hypothetical protein